MGTSGWRNWGPARTGLGLGGTCAIGPRNRLLGSWEEHGIPGFEFVVSPLKFRSAF